MDLANLAYLGRWLGLDLANIPCLSRLAWHGPCQPLMGLALATRRTWWGASLGR